VSLAAAWQALAKGLRVIPVEATPEQIAYWTERAGHEPVRRVIGGPEEAPDVMPCPTLVGLDQTQGEGVVVCRVAFQLDEIEVASLAQGGTLWLSTWGGLPIHLVEVVPR
jgi:hypothetical protein